VLVVFITAIVVMITKIIEFVSARKKAAMDITTAKPDSTISKQRKWRLISDLFLMTSIITYFLSTAGSSAPATRSDLSILSFVILTIIILFRPNAPSA